MAGIDAAVRLAGLAGRRRPGVRLAADRGEPAGSVARATRAAAAANGGAVPPALDRRGGRPGATGGWPTRTARSTRAIRSCPRRSGGPWRASAEGIATYAGKLHDYTGFRIFETELERGEQAAVVAGLYGELAHATGTYGGFETDIRPTGRRSSTANLTPHGTYSGELVTLIRNMLVRDAAPGGSCSSAPCRAPGSTPGRVVAVTGAPTAAGRVSLHLRARAGGATLSWRAPAGAALTWPVPYAVSGLPSGVAACPGACWPAGLERLARRALGARPGGPTLAGTIARLRRAYAHG